MERTHGRKHFARALLEGAAFVGRSILEEIELTYGKVDRIQLSGGLSRLDVVNKIKADVYGYPVEVVSEFESTVVGAFLVAFGNHLHGNADKKEAVKRLVQVRQIVFPDRERQAVYAEKYRIFKDVYAALTPVFEKYKNAGKTIFKNDDSYLENL